MQTILILIDAKKLENPDLDIRYDLPDRIDEYTDAAVKDNGYDFISNSLLGIWLETADCESSVNKVIELIKSERFSGNDLSKTAEIYISEDNCAPPDKCRKVFPTN